MSQPTVPVVKHRSDIAEAGATGGMARFEAFTTDDRWVGYVTTEPGVMGGWHHHGDTDTYVYIVRGELVVEFGAGGQERLSGGPGDFLHVPAGVIHREGTAPGAPGEAVVVRIGSGPPVVNVDGPAG